MEHTKELLSVPLVSLVPSRFNVRRHSFGQVEEVAALIEARGLLHNLVVSEQGIEALRNAICAALKTWAPEQKAHSGVIVTVGCCGDVEGMRGLVCDKDRKAIAAAVRSKGSAGHRSSDGGTGENAGTPSMSAPEGRAPGCRDALKVRLAAHRSMVLRAMLVQNTMVRRAAVAHVFMLRTFGVDDLGKASALLVSPQLSGFALEAMADDLRACRAWQAVQQAPQAWYARLPEHQSEWFGWLMDRSQVELIELLALCGALTENGLPGLGAAPSVAAIMAALDMDMADWWQPTDLAYLNHMPKAQIIAALKWAGLELLGGGDEATKKDARVAAAALQRARTRWLPEPLCRSPG